MNKSVTVFNATSAVLGETLEHADINASMAALDALLDGPVTDESIEGIDLGLSAGDEVPDDLLEAVSADVKMIERTQEVMASIAAEEPSIAAADVPATDPDAEVVVTPKKGKGKKKANADAGAEKPKVERVHFHSHSKSAVLLHRLGGNRDVLNLEVDDFTLDAETLKAKQDTLLMDLDTTTAKKVGEKAIMVLTGKSHEQEVLKRAFTVLATDGFLTSGDRGNLQTNLLSKPYSLGTARSQANQIFCLFPLLKITKHDGKGRQIPNPNSTILAQVLMTLGLTMKAAD